MAGGKSELFEAIKFDLATGSIVYPAVPGFELNKEKVYGTVELFLPHCNGSIEKAVCLAVHGQITAYLGAKSLFSKNYGTTYVNVGGV